MAAFSRNLKQTLDRAMASARERHHEYATLEHLLLSLIEDPDAAAVLRSCAVDLDLLAKNLRDCIERELGNLINDESDECKPTAGFQRVVQRAIISVQSSGREDVNGANVLVALFAERESYAVYFLQEQDMTRYDAVNYISHGIAKRPGLSDTSRTPRGSDDDSDRSESRDGRDGDSRKKEGALEAYCVNLNRKARDQGIDPLIGREAEVARTIQVLCRR
ncbi:MAG TPA: Clp protease N-terminal domain-containing protein, partial [Methylocystis sp.]|nr:Clp protease N-terminal domain-containing protein [Methylocystis sp.]